MTNNLLPLCQEYYPVVLGKVHLMFRLKGRKKMLVQTARNELRMYDNDKCSGIFCQLESVKAYSFAHAGTKQEVVTTWSNGDVNVINY